jgi:hypothetical protein
MLQIEAQPLEHNVGFWHSPTFGNVRNSIAIGGKADMADQARKRRS